MARQCRGGNPRHHPVSWETGPQPATLTPQSPVNSRVGPAGDPAHTGCNLPGRAQRIGGA
ncbi:hypothetical protein [Halomonas binhaiensis]|uniref:Uncharacterized protein n=1 Tax=Halomonas binhaiensis TaxID=2562282 RepID=A0A5C1NP19_9GAMM|nr:hypothetical protein [Halomonas binhaiensis]QEM83599.1 hypothetical protein E4T21_20055 [Halomonas binhaiensis]